MRSGIVAATVLAVASLTGCAGMSYAMKHYSGVEIDRYTAETGATFRVFDKPEEGRLMITSSISGALGSGAVQGLTLGAVRPTEAAVVFRDAAEGYLASTGRNCRAIDTTLVVNPQYEVRYECAPDIASAEML